MHIATKEKNIVSYRKYLSMCREIESFLDKKRYLKVDLPVLSPALIPESYLEIFETEFRYFESKEKLYLTPSPELFLKRLLVAGVGDCYSLGKAFRNGEPDSSLHSPEFTMLEFYKMKANYMDIADEVLQMLSSIAQALKGKNQIIYQGKKVKFDRWEKVTVAEAFERYADIKEVELFDKERFIKKVKDKGYSMENASYEDVFSQVYSQEVELHLGKSGYPTVIYDYPKEFAALAKLNSNGKTAQRFEFYIEGLELGDCYTELTDWKEQELRFKEEAKKRRETGKIGHPIDNGFIEALTYGLDDCAGIAIGVERLGMVFADVDSIDKLKLINIR